MRIERIGDEGVYERAGIGMAVRRTGMPQEGMCAVKWAERALETEIPSCGNPQTRTRPVNLGARIYFQRPMGVR